MKVFDAIDCMRSLGEAAVASLLDELELTPKPGLVDRHDTGVHDDLTFELMVMSAISLKAVFEEIAYVSFGRTPSQRLREEIAGIGRDGEKVMLQATGGTNSHKGAIWALGLLVSSAAVHRCHTNPFQLLKTAGEIACFEDRFVPIIKTNGSQVKQLYNVHGAKEEAEMGFPHIVQYGLPTLLNERKNGSHESTSRIHTLVALIAHLDDTCILHRGGIEALKRAKKLASAVLENGGTTTEAGSLSFLLLTKSLLCDNASPGGSADLLAATLFVDRICHSPTVFYENQTESITSS